MSQKVQIKIDNKFMPIVARIYKKKKYQKDLKAYWNQGKKTTNVNIVGDKELVEKFKKEIEKKIKIQKLIESGKYWFIFIEKKDLDFQQNMMGYRHALMDYNIKEDLYKIELDEGKNPRDYYEEKMEELMNDLVPFNDNGLYLFIVYKDDDKNYAYIQFNKKNYKEKYFDTIFGTMIKVENHESEMTKKIDDIYNNIAYANYAVYRRDTKLKINESEGNLIKEYLKEEDLKEEDLDKVYLREEYNVKCVGSLIENIKNRGVNISKPTYHDKPRYCFFEENHIYHVCEQCYIKIKAAVEKKKKDSEIAEFMKNFIKLEIPGSEWIDGIKMLDKAELKKEMEENNFVNVIRDYYHSKLRFIDIRKHINNKSFAPSKNKILGFGNFKNIKPAKIDKKAFSKLLKKSIIDKYNYLFELDDDKREQQFNIYLLSMIEGGDNDWEMGESKFLVEKRSKNSKIEELEFKKYWNFLQEVKENDKLKKYWNEEVIGPVENWTHNWVGDRQELYNLFEEHYKDPNEEVAPTSEGFSATSSEGFSATSSEPVPIDEPVSEGIIKVKLYNVTDK